MTPLRQRQCHTCDDLPHAIQASINTSRGDPRSEQYHVIHRLTSALPRRRRTAFPIQVSV
jgi:hypothetical protein